MWNKSKVKELGLVYDGPECLNQARGIMCPKEGCCVCSNIYHEIHYELIVETGKWDCSACLNTKRLLKMDEKKMIGCVDCKKIIEEYAKADFKDIFNELKR